MRRSGRAASNRPIFGGLGSSSSLMTRAFGARSAIVVSRPDRHRDAAARGMVLDDDRHVHGGRDREVVGEDRVVVRPGEGRRREHDRMRAGGSRLAGVGDRPVRGRVA